MTGFKLILASGSPRRKELLEGLGLDFVVRPADIDETPLPQESADNLVLRLARGKALHQIETGEVTLAADTVVVLDGKILGKPRNRVDAVAMLASLHGREHEVYSGIAVAVGPDEDQCFSEAVVTKVKMAPMTDAEIAWYATTGEPDDKAGAYGIQGIGALFVERVDGNYTNVVGLPLPRVYRLFQHAGLDLRRPMTS